LPSGENIGGESTYCPEIRKPFGNILSQTGFSFAEFPTGKLSDV